MPRIRSLALHEFDPELLSLLNAEQKTERELRPTSVRAHHPELAKAYLRFGGALKTHSVLSARLRELIRLRIAFHNQCRSCMAIRYKTAVDDGMTEGMVCSLEKPQEAADLNEAEKAALRYAELSCVDHLSISEATFDDLRDYFSEAQIVELGMFIAFFIGFGRLSAAWDMVEELPDAFKSKDTEIIAPWGEEAILVRG